MCKPVIALDEYERVLPLLRQIHISQDVLHAVDLNPVLKPHYNAIYSIYWDILKEELAPHALDLAHALVNLQHAYPEIPRNVQE